MAVFVGSKISIVTGNQTALIDNKEVPLAVKPFQRDGDFFVAIGVFRESLSAHIRLRYQEQDRESRISRQNPHGAHLRSTRQALNGGPPWRAC